MKRFRWKIQLLSFPLFAAACASLLNACAWIDEVGKEKSHAQIRMTNTNNELPDSLQCAAEQFPVDFYYFDAESPYDGAGLIRMYHSPVDSLWTNELSISFAKTDLDTLQDCPDPSDLAGQELTLSRNGCARATLQINACEKQITAQIYGSLKLDQFDIKRGERISGSIEGKLSYTEILNSSTDKLERRHDIGDIEGEFAFTVKAGAVWKY